MKWVVKQFNTLAPTLGRTAGSWRCTHVTLTNISGALWTEGGQTFYPAWVGIKHTCWFLFNTGLDTLLGLSGKLSNVFFLLEVYYEADKSTDWAAYSLLHFEGKYSLIPLLKNPHVCTNTNRICPSAYSFSSYPFASFIYDKFYPINFKITDEHKCGAFTYAAMIKKINELI